MNQPRPDTAAAAADCPRCGRRQPPFAGPTLECLYCGTRLVARAGNTSAGSGGAGARQYGDWNRPGLGRPAPALRRWVAHTPVLPAQRHRTAQRRSWRSGPYTGPPSYGDRHPRGGFRPGSWRWPDQDDTDAKPVDRQRRRTAQRLRYAAVVVAVTALSALAAAVAESWRLALLLRGRTEVLDGGTVRASDLFVGIAGWWTLGLSVLAAVLTVPAIITAHQLSATLLGRAAARPVRQLWQYLLVPVWNIYGAGIVVTETDRQLRWSDPDRGAGTDPSRARGGSSSLLVWAVWALWTVGGVLAVLVVIRMFGSGDQARADGVQLRIAADALAGLLGVLLTVLLWRWSRLVDVPRTAATGWVVAAPEPTSDRRVPCPRGEKNEHADARVGTVG
ncbi:DUF4328 domain-containing protein [Nakamurella aerolata]|uniref:DUF4328 domain-containing protein n=1 Tax=Nakamurella aerolata TaxID=1656892 RepID=A0A849A901_9ACTN|nr:DUF4328 domain-containing protein [Nakamurella aerolata]